MGIVNQHDYDYNKNGAGLVVGNSVRALREALAGLPDDALVVMAKDAEGNAHSPLALISHDPRGDGILYEAETTWMGELTWQQDREGEDAYGPESPDADDVARCIVLVPIN